MKVLHILDHSLPIQSGYAMRSDAILRALRDRGIETVQLTSPKHAREDSEHATVNEITYVRAPAVDGDGAAAQWACIRTTRSAARRLIAREHPDVVHAHSPCLNGLAVLGLGVPVVYEMRSSWEDAAVSSGKTVDGSIRYRLSRRLETFAVQRADAVVVICEGLRQELLYRGIGPQHIYVVGNAIDPDRLAAAPAERVECLRRRLKLESRTVLGFFGSFFAWEGLDVLIEALPSIVAGDASVVVVLVGDGEDTEKLRRMVDARGLGESVRFVGRVNHDEIPTYYGLADIMVFPRRRMKLTDMVTPLKPIESMHLGCVVGASDVGGHRELIEHGRTGYLFRADDPMALSASLLSMLGERVRWPALRAEARRYVERERVWSSMAERYQRLYAMLVGTDG